MKYRGFEINVQCDEAGYRFTIENEWGVAPSLRYYFSEPEAIAAAQEKIQRMLAKLALSHVVKDFLESGKISIREYNRFTGWS